MKKRNMKLMLGMLVPLSMVAVACGGNDELNEAMDEEREEANENNGNAADTDNDADDMDADNNNNDTDDNENNEAAGEAQDGGTVNIGLIGDPVAFMTTHTTDTTSGAVEDMVYNQLGRIDEDIEIQPELAHDWEISDDGLTYTFHLEEDVYFHDGEPLTSEDVKFTFDIFLDEDYTGPRASYFSSVDEVVAVDETTVEFHLDEIDARVLANVTAFGIMPKHHLEDIPAEELEESDFSRDPIGSGPFTFEEWEDGQYLQLEANEDYWEGEPNLDRITMSIVGDQNAAMAQLEAGDIDITTIPATDFSTAEAWDEEGLIDLRSTLGFQYNYMGYNMDRDMFADKETRQALTHAIDREAIIDQVGQGQGEVAHGPVSPLSWAYSEDMPEFEYDPDRARELLEEAGWEEGGDGILERDGERFEFTLATNSGNQIREDIAVIVQSMLNDVGVEVTPEYVEWGAFLDQIQPPNWDFDAVILGWGLATDPDPSALWHSREYEQGQNNVNYQNDEVDELIDENIRIVDEEERAEMLQEIFEMIAEDQPYTFLYYPNDLKAVPTNLEGFVHHPRLDFYRPQDWSLTEE